MAFQFFKDDLPLGKKLNLALTLCVGLLIVLGALSVGITVYLNSSYSYLLNNEAEFTFRAIEEEVKVLQLRRYEKDILINLGNVENQKKYYASFTKTLMELEKNTETLKELSEKLKNIDDESKKKIA